MHDSRSTRIDPPEHDPPETPDGTSPTPPATIDDARAPTHAGPYRIEAEIARGGMGIVYRAYDPGLERPLAVKVLAAARQASKPMTFRFLQEARLTGQLQHPGIPPVHEMGLLADGRPFFAMKLIRGQTLAALLAGRTDDDCQLPRFVAVFEHICQTMAYVHRQGVIHRDLKPSNVMVGAFGEVQVMDWGLAREMRAGRDSSAPEGYAGAVQYPPVAAPRYWDLTLPNHAVGTPAYMAPEQIHGETADARADVFGLGGILCEILTGQPPCSLAEPLSPLGHAGRDLAATHERLRACGADAELVALACACLAERRDDRPADAGEVADRLEAYQAGVRARLRAAELARAAAVVRAGEERKRRRLAVGLATAVVALIILAAGGGLWVQRQQAERTAEQAAARERLRQATAGALEQAAALVRQERWPEATAVLTDAIDRLGDDDDDCHRQLGDRLTEVRLGEALEAARLEAVVQWRHDRPVVRHDDQAYLLALRRHGLDPLAGDAAAVAGRIEGLCARAAVCTALDHWAAGERDRAIRDRLLTVLGRVDPDPWNDQLRRLDPTASRTAVDRLAAGADVAAVSPVRLAMLAAHVRSAGGDPVPLLERAHRQHPSDFWLTFQLAGALLHRPGRHADAVRYYEAAVALRPRSAVVLNNLAAALLRSGDLPAAAAALRRATALDPALPHAHLNLAAVLREQGQLAAAAEAAREADRLQPGLADGAAMLAICLLEADDSTAEAAVARALRAGANHPAALAAHARLLLRRDDLPAALSAARAAVRLAPTQPYCLNVLVEVLIRRGEATEAVTHCRASLAIQPHQPLVLELLGVLLLARNDRAAALDAFRQAVRLDPKVWQAYRPLVRDLSERERHDDALALARQAVTQFPDKGEAHALVGVVLSHRGDAGGAIEPLRRAIVLNPDLGDAHHYLGMALRQTGDRPGAAAAFRRAVAFAPTAAVYTDLGNALAQLADWPAAVRAYQGAVLLAPRSGEAHARLASARYRIGDVAGSAGSFQSATDLQPADPRPYLGLGQARLQLGDVRGAAAAFRRGLERLPDDDTRLRPGVQLQLRQLEPLLVLDRQLDAVLVGGPPPADVRQTLTLARFAREVRRLDAESAGLYAAALADLPAEHADPRRGWRYRAGCAAVRTAEVRDRLRWHRQALTWLAADLAAWDRLTADAATRRTALAEWQSSADLAPVRDPARLARLPADEAAAWRRLWAEVDRRVRP